MGPITYSLCHTQYIGLAMWLSGLCYFPPLVEPTEISLHKTGSVLREDFDAPVEKLYLLKLKFKFPSTEARLSDTLVGGGYYGKYCNGAVPYEKIPADKLQSVGLPVPFKVQVRNQSDGGLVVDQVFQSLCKFAHSGNTKSREMGWVSLKEGSYQIEIFNQSSQPAFEDIKIEFSLVSREPK